MSVIRALLHILFFYSFSAIVFIAAIFSMALPHRYFLACAKLWARGLLGISHFIGGVNYRFSGLENIPQGGCIIACKHQSAWETFALLWAVPDPSFILKAELLRIPLLGWYGKKMGIIPIERTKKGSALRQMYKNAAAEIAKGRQIIIFPEGTRRPVGAPPHYKQGIVHLYKNLNVAVVPVAVNSGLFWPKNKLWRKVGTVDCVFLPPIEANLPANEFMARLQNAIETHSDKLAKL